MTTLLCHYCERPLYRDKGPQIITKDHKLPRSRGGGGYDNYALACRDCNELKGDLTDTEFEAAVLWLVDNNVSIQRTTRGHYRPLTRIKPIGFFAGLTAEQQASALAYRGPENFGDPALTRK